MSDSELIPIIDFSTLSSDVSGDKLDYKAMKPIALEVMDALRNPGFLYLKNSGLTSEEVSTMNLIAEHIFLKPKEVKENSARGREIERHHGWIDVSFWHWNKLCIFFFKFYLSSSWFLFSSCSSCFSLNSNLYPKVFINVST